MEVLAFSVFTYISIMGTQTGSSLKNKKSAILYSKLDRKVSTICFSLASDASEILPSALKHDRRLSQMNNVQNFDNNVMPEIFWVRGKKNLT